MGGMCYLPERSERLVRREEAFLALNKKSLIWKAPYGKRGAPHVM